MLTILRILYASAYLYLDVIAKVKNLSGIVRINADKERLRAKPVCTFKIVALLKILKFPEKRRRVVTLILTNNFKHIQGMK